MRLRAVVFEDEPLTRQLLWTVCDQREYEVFTFPHPGFCPLYSVERCPCSIGTQCADVIVSGLQMPNVNGLDFLQALMGKGCLKPQFALTSDQWMEAEIERARELGCQVFIKPLYVSSINQWLEEVEALTALNRKLISWYDSKWLSKAVDSGGQK